MSKGITRRKKPAAPVKHGERYLFGFVVASSSGRRNYKISFDTARGCWICSCPGCISHQKTCKHLRACGLIGPEQLGQDLPTRNQANRAKLIGGGA